MALKSWLMRASPLAVFGGIMKRLLKQSTALVIWAQRSINQSSVPA
jgi:hypothetical protein